MKHHFGTRKATNLDHTYHTFLRSRNPGDVGNLYTVFSIEMSHLIKNLGPQFITCNVNITNIDDFKWKMLILKKLRGMPSNFYIFWILSNQNINVLIQQLHLLINIKHWNNGRHWSNRKPTIDTLEKGVKRIPSQQ